MNKMVLSAVAAVCLAVWSFNVFADLAASNPVSEKRVEGIWFTSMSEAKTAAQMQNKLILVLFTGSDWCPWSVRLNYEVFMQKPFLDYASKKLILLKVDFPRNNFQTKPQKKINEKLRMTYGVTGFPTVLLLDPAGDVVIVRTGYRSGGADSFVMHLEEELNKKK